MRAGFLRLCDEDSCVTHACRKHTHGGRRRGHPRRADHQACRPGEPAPEHCAAIAPDRSRSPGSPGSGQSRRARLLCGRACSDDPRGPPDDIEARLAGLAHRGQFIAAARPRRLARRDSGARAITHAMTCMRDILSEQDPPQPPAALAPADRYPERDEAMGRRAREDQSSSWPCTSSRGRDWAAPSRYLRRAADNALHRSAHTDAIAHLTPALALLAARCPGRPSAKRRRAGPGRRLLGPALMAIKGYAAPEVGTGLCAGVRAVPAGGRHAPALCRAAGACVIFIRNGPSCRPHVVLQKLLRVAQRRQDPRTSSGPTICSGLP